MKQIVFLLSFLLISAAGQAQVNIAFGYNAGMFTTPQRNFEILEYSYRNVMPGFKIPNFLRGPSLGFRMEDENVLAEFLFTQKTMSTSKYDYVGSDGETYDYKLKMQLRTINFGFAFGGESMKIGVSMDVGRFRAMKKNGISSDDPAWEKYYGMNTWFGGFTFFAPIRVGVFELRPYFQMSWFVDKFGVLGHTHRSDNVGINLSYVWER
ncbi:MAG: hypothetical protein IPM74_17550 [Crocinitomicaceae bacterium]|nr:hypothetical protein [Crocinitomicaceae bacterium]MBK8927653.1 hypothetical protein [Crocinitomicaceae bacterium]